MFHLLSFHFTILTFADRECYIGSQLAAFLWIVGIFSFLDYTADFPSFSCILIGKMLSLFNILLIHVHHCNKILSLLQSHSLSND